jgi:hypothetical protein
LNAGVAPCERMNRSAAESSSAVVTPGAKAASRRSSVSATIAPARRMMAISSEDFL